MKKHLRWAVVLIFFMGSWSLNHTSASSSVESKEYQRQIDAMMKMHDRLIVPDNQEDIKKLKGSFDVNHYFKVLNHLSLENGWVLDYIYYFDGLGSYPIIIARKQGEALLSPQACQSSGASPAHEAKEYLSHIVIDGTREGYFQFVILSLIGPRFALGWHANYNDTEILCTRGAMKRILGKKEKSQYSLYNFDQNFITKAKRIKPEPRIVLTEDGANIRLVTFTKWGGLMEKEYTVTKTFPHRITHWKEKVLAVYDCGLFF